MNSASEKDKEAMRRFEERFGGGESAALGELRNGQPAGLAKNVKNNMYRII